MVSDKDLREVRKAAVEEGAEDSILVAIIDDFLAARKLHREEQRRSADRLKVALEELERNGS